MNNNKEKIEDSQFDAIVVGTGISGGWAAKEQPPEIPVPTTIASNGVLSVFAMLLSINCNFWNFLLWYCEI